MKEKDLTTIPQKRSLENLSLSNVLPHCADSWTGRSSLSQMMSIFEYWIEREINADSGTAQGLLTGIFVLNFFEHLESSTPYEMQQGRPTISLAENARLLQGDLDASTL